MGAVVSRVKVLAIAVKQVLEISKAYERLLKRIEASPGLPVDNPTLPFWLDVPSPIANHLDELPAQADVVIIGSGITGASVARTLLHKGPSSLKVVMLEARETCSGATGRNGGHIKPPLQHDYSTMKRKLGVEQAKALMRFRQQHVDEIQAVAESEDILDKCQGRDVESLDVYFDEEIFEEAKEQLRIWKNDMPEESKDFFYLTGKDAIERFHLAPDVVGVVYNPAGAIHPYRFVTHILSHLLKCHSERFSLLTRTPVTSILGPSNAASSNESEASGKSNSSLYSVVTPRGVIQTPHIIHATNAWVSHLLEPFRTKIFPVRGNMSAQRPGVALSPSTLDGGRSWVFYDRHLGYDYLTQLPPGPKGSGITGKEMMFGGGFFQGGGDGLGELGCVDDSKYNPGVAAHLAGSLPILFGGKNWGSEGLEERDGKGDDRWFEGRVKALWSGIIGISADRVPWVGRVPPKLAGRSAPSPSLNSSPSFCGEKIGGESNTSGLAVPGEWIAAGYSGEGMAHAFLSGRAVAYMLLDQEGAIKEWFPDSLRVTEQRWKKARAEDLVEELWG